MLKSLLLSTLLTNLTYLGYSKQFSQSRMFVDLIGLRKEIFIHNLSHTVFYFKKVLNILSNIWANFASIWLIVPQNEIIKNYFYSVSKRPLLQRVLYFWLDKWHFGFITSNTRFALSSSKLVYPSSLLYLNYTDNSVKLLEGRRAQLIQLGLADSNSLRSYYNYLINANEKSPRSYLYFLNVIFLSAMRFIYQNKKLLLF